MASLFAAALSGPVAALAAATPTPSTVTAERIFGGLFSWSHQLREDLSSNASAGWYRTLFLDNSGRRDNVYTISIGLTYNLSRTATATLSLSRSDQRSNIPADSLLDNIVLASVRKQF